MMTQTRGRRFALVLFAAGMLCAGAVASPAAAQDLLTRAKRDGIRTALFNEVPFAYTDANGQLTGSDIHISRKILNDMGITKIEGVVTEFSSLIPGLKANRFDIIAAGLSIRPARCKEVAFSEPYFAYGDGLLVKGGNPLKLHSYQDVAKNPAVRLGYVTGGVEREHALAMGVKASQLSPFTDLPSGMAAIKAGRIDAFATPGISIQALVDTAKDPTIERAQPWTDPVINGKEAKNYSGSAFRKEDQAFLDEFNRRLKAFIGTPEFLAMVRPFGFTESEVPRNVTTAQLCAGG